MILATTMNTRTLFSFLLALVFACASGCRSTPANDAPPVTHGGWEPAPSFDASRLAGRRIRVVSEDPARSNLGPRLVRGLTDALASKGYEAVTNSADADFLCVLVIRYFGRSVPPDGHLELLAAAGADPILGGDDGWLAPDGSGFDTVTRKSKAIRFRSRARGWFGKLFKGPQDDEWDVVIDVAIGTRQSEQRSVVQRHEGRLWASAVGSALGKLPATELLLAEINSQLPAKFP